MYIVSKVWNFIKTRRKLSLAAFVIILAVVGICAFMIFSHVGVSTAHAQTPAPVVKQPTTNPATATPDRGMLGKVVDIIGGIFLTIAQLFIQVTIFLLRYIIEVGAYNGYISSTAVNYGWIMVRDVTNMFFVIILLVIAFGTILGLEQYEYKKLLFKMIIAAVIVNFSRTICGLIIDIAQVIMVTFINGVAATAGGNLINMFNMQEVLQMARSTNGADVTSRNVFLATVAALVFSAMAMATMFVFLIMLLARLITLWILIVLSPLAFVLNVIPQTQKYSSQWWTEFGNNVISGPIIAFFLWLAFVSVGSGNANQDIVDGLPNTSLSVGGTATENVSAATAGLSKAMDWTKMASFGIAIGMLLMGAKMAQQLGVAGGAMMGKAVDFGKRVGMAASGITAARWAGRKGLAAGKAAGKFVAMKAPIVGGEAWQRRGRAIAGRASLAWGKAAEYRNVKAKEWEEKKGWRGVLGKIGGRMIETGGRKMKRATDWQEAAKTQKKVVDEMLGVGGAAGGIAKTRAALRLEKAEEMGKEIKAGVFEEQRKKMLEGGAGMTAEQIKVAVDAEGTVAAAAEILEHARKELEEAQQNLKDGESIYGKNVAEEYRDPGKIRELEDQQKLASKQVADAEKKYKSAYGKEREKYKGKEARPKTFDEEQYALRAQEAVSGRAKAELLKTQREREEEKKVARTKDAAESARLGVPIHAREDQVLAKHAKEDVELENIPNYDKAMLNIGNIGGRIKELSGKTRTPEEDAMLEELKKKLGNAVQVNVANSAERGLDALERAMSSLGLGGEISADDKKISTVQSRLLSAHLGRKVETDPNEIGKAMEEMEKRFGHAYMEQMKDRIDNMSGQNAVNYAGAFKYDDKGRVKATDANDEKDLADIGRKREWARNRIRSTDESKKGAKGMMDQNPEGQTVIVSDAAIENVAKLLGGLSQQNIQNVPNENYQQVARALENNGTRIGDVISRMSERSQSDLGGLAASLTRLAGEIKGEKTEIKGMRDQLSRAAELARQQLVAQRQAGKRTR